MGKIVSLGEVVADIYRDSGGTGMRMPFTARPGGSPANKAVAVARLGTESAFIGAVGEDLFGDFALRALEDEGVDVRGVVRQKAPTRTSIAFVELSETGDREFTFYRSDPAADAFQLTARRLTAVDLDRFKGVFREVFGRIDQRWRFRWMSDCTRISRESRATQAG